MMNTLSHLGGSTVTASDGAIGKVAEAYFEDQAWAIRYLVVDTGTWLSGREVLILPYAVKQPLSEMKNVDVALTRQQVQSSPDIDTHQPVSRRHEREVLGYYDFPEYWGGDALWAMNSMPLLTPAMAGTMQTPEERAAVADTTPPEDVHLRSSAAVRGYDIQATDDSIGHVDDFVFDDETWAIRYLVVDTRNWWPGGKKVLIATHWIDDINWADRSVSVRLTREQVKASPAFDEGVRVSRDYEQRLHDAYDRRGYWD